MSIEARFDAARKILDEHNIALGWKPGETVARTDDPFIDPDRFVQLVKASGGTNEERLKKMTAEDLLHCMRDMLNNIPLFKPMPLAKDLVRALRGTDEKKEESKEYVSGKKADRMSAHELVMAFDPNDHTNPVGERLKKISKEEPFIVFSDDLYLDRDTSFRLLREIQKGFKGRTVVTVNGVDKPVYRVGEIPEQYADENPIYERRPLRPDGTCDQTNRSWDGVPLEVRQLVRLAIETGEFTVKDAHDIMDFAVGPDAMTKIRQRCKKASLEFNRYQKMDTLPKLKIAMVERSAVAKRPFENGKKVVCDTTAFISNAPIVWFNRTPIEPWKEKHS